MIRAEELRIGNWVSGNFPNMIVNALNRHHADLYMPESEADDFCYEFHELEGIPLTPEILEKFGFAKHMDDQTLFFLNEFRYSVYHKEVKLLRICDKAGESQQHACGFPFLTDRIKINYLHQLQNLFFALTGTELEYSPVSPSI